MIEGLTLTMTGEEIQRILEERIQVHEQRAERWTREAEGEAAERARTLPPHLCANEVEQELWRAAVLRFLREHLDASEVYHLHPTELELAELLPEKPEWMDEDDGCVTVERLSRSGRWVKERW